MQMSCSYGIRLAFQKLLRTSQTSRNNKKLCKKAFWLWLIIFRKLRNKLHTRVKSFLTYKRKSLRVQQPVRNWGCCSYCIYKKWGSPYSFKRKRAFISLSNLFWGKSLTFCTRARSFPRANDAKIVRSRMCNAKLGNHFNTDISTAALQLRVSALLLYLVHQLETYEESS